MKMDMYRKGQGHCPECQKGSLVKFGRPREPLEFSVYLYVVSIQLCRAGEIFQNRLTWDT